METNRVHITIGESTNTCFIAMPFAPMFTAEYESVIRPSVERAGLSCIRGDEIYSKRNIVADVWKAIRECRLVIAELSGRNPNVLYEIGLAHAIGKPVILLTRNEKDVPCDLKSLRYLVDETKDPFWGKSLAGAIESLVLAILADTVGPFPLEGIELSVTSTPTVPIGAQETPAYSGAIDNTSWVGLWGAAGNRHSGTLLVRQSESRLFATLVVTHEHDTVVTIVHEALTGVVQSDKVSLHGTAYTFLIQGLCPGYGLDVFDLNLAEGGLAMEGTIPQRNRRGDLLSTHQVRFTRAHVEDGSAKKSMAGQLSAPNKLADPGRG